MTKLYENFKHMNKSDSAIDRLITNIDKENKGQTHEKIFEIACLYVLVTAFSLLTIICEAKADAIIAIVGLALSTILLVFSISKYFSHCSTTDLGARCLKWNKCTGYAAYIITIVPNYGSSKTMNTIGITAVLLLYAASYYMFVIFAKNTSK